MYIIYFIARNFAAAAAAAPVMKGKIVSVIGAVVDVQFEGGGFL